MLQVRQNLYQLLQAAKGDIPYGLDAQCNVGNTVGISINYDMFKVGDGSTFATKDSALTTVGAVFKW